MSHGFIELEHFYAFQIVLQIREQEEYLLLQCAMENDSSQERENTNYNTNTHIFTSSKRTNTVPVYFISPTKNEREKINYFLFNTKMLNILGKEKQNGEHNK